MLLQEALDILGYLNAKTIISAFNSKQTGTNQYIHSKYSFLFYTFFRLLFRSRVKQ